VGQVARERKPIILEVSDDAAAPIVTGTMLALPRFTYTYPLLHEKELVGVIELASFEHFDERKLEYLSNITGMLASFLFAAEQRVHIRKLLAASEESEREMRAQSEQLRESNARMEEQQQQLQQQAEELQQTNAQMEEAQQQLRQQTEELQQTNAQMEESQQQLEQQNQELEEAKRQQEAKARQLDQASKYKSEFLANMSHELRTPLNSIILLSKMIVSSENGEVQGEAQKWAQVIHRSGEDLLRLINDVLDLSKVEAGRMDVHLATLSTRDLCFELQGMFEHLARDKGLDFVIDDQLRRDFVSDPDKLSQILRNLLTNAIKFTREGSVTFRPSEHGAAYPAQRARYRHRHFRRQEGRDFRGLPAGGRLHLARIRRHRAGPDHQPALRPDAGRHHRAGKQAGRRQRVHRLAAGKRRGLARGGQPDAAAAAGDGARRQGRAAAGRPRGAADRRRSGVRPDAADDEPAAGLQDFAGRNRRRGAGIGRAPSAGGHSAGPGLAGHGRHPGAA
jgi:signal transduction histidine kinase